MRDFSNLYWQLDSTTRTGEKVAALAGYFANAASKDAAWAMSFLVGRRIKRLLPMKSLRAWAIQESGLSDWLFDECYDRVGDLAETISLILPDTCSDDDIPLQELVETHLLPMRSSEPDAQRRTVLGLWNIFDQREKFVLGKLITGGFRVGVSKRLVIRALAEAAGIENAVVAHRLMGDWEPTARFFETVVSTEDTGTPVSKPYPFFLANPLQQEPAELGEAREWLIEWKWDGIRAQLIRREGQTFIWSRGEDLVTDQFPEVAEAAEQLPDGTVIDGEILAWDVSGSKPLEFSQLQRRLGRKRVGAKLLGEVPVVLLAFDLIENRGLDIRQEPLETRQSQLDELISRISAVQQGQQGTLFSEPEATAVPIRIPPIVAGKTWDDFAEQRQRSRGMRAEGLMLKRRGSSYQVNRPVGDWWKWKIDPYTVDAVLIYAQRGHGRRASLYTDYTFAVWDETGLVPFAKAYSGLTDEEIRKVDAFVRKNTHERFGPVRSVTPQLVFELAFEDIQKSTRHKSGIAVRFPRISRWRQDKKPDDADSLKTILSMLEGE